MNLLGEKKKWYLIVSGLIILTGLIFLLIFGLRPGIDFAGGSLIEVELNRKTSADEIKAILKDESLENLSIYQIGERGWIIKSKEINEGKKQEIISAIERKIGESGGENSGRITEKRFETVGPTVSNDLKRKSILAVILAIVAIVFYIVLAFRKLPNFLSPWKFGLAAIVALIHDILIVLGIFGVLSYYFGFEVDALFITALLTILSYSVHDTIVVFDRIRENFKTSSPISNESLETVANYSLIQTLARSLNISLTIILVMVAMLALGGNTLYPFILTLLIGIITGTYSSLFIGTPLLVYWHKNK